MAVGACAEIEYGHADNGSEHKDDVQYVAYLEVFVFLWLAAMMPRRTYH